VDISTQRGRSRSQIKCIGTIQRRYFARGRERGSVCEDFDIIIDKLSPLVSMLHLRLAPLNCGFAGRVQEEILTKSDKRTSKWHRSPRFVSKKLPVSVSIGSCAVAVGGVRLDSPANIFLIALLMHAASRRTTNSKPSLDMSVTYLLEPCFWLELAMVGCLRRMCRC
jgi:hypothetical protein